MRFCRKTYLISLLFLVCSCLLPNTSKAQFDSIHFKDDPVVAMLDSLTRLNFFNKPARTAKFKYNLPPDSIPRFDDLIYEARMAKLDAASPFDLVYNEPVRAFIDLYVVRKRLLVSRMVGLSQLYYPMMEEVLDKYGLPLELKHLAVIESALNPNAKSRSGAMGLWQFMFNTGKLYGLNNTSYVDDRCDPYKATVAAAEYLKFLYGLFGDWQMVLAAYNSGPGTVMKAMRRSGNKKSYWEIRPFLPRETQSYVPAFIAANYVMNYYGEHNIYPSEPRKSFFETDTVNIKQQVSFEQISHALNISMDELVFLNPMYKRAIVPYPNGNKPYELILPASKVGTFVTNETAIYSCLKKDSALAKSGMAAEEVRKLWTVQKGEHLNLIARSCKCTVDDLRTWNGLTSSYVKPGQKLIYYATTSRPILSALPPVQTPAVASQVVQNTDPAPVAAYKGFVYYTIQKGDTLWIISQRNKTTVDAIKRLNGWGKNFKLLPGSKIKVAKA
ncbi:MAG: transglycosylase SLT domain-containing protein [Bacteroidia bacterium]